MTAIAKQAQQPRKTLPAPAAPQPLTPEQLRQIGGGDRPRGHNY